MPSPTTVAYHVPPTQLQNFGNISLPEESKCIGGPPYPEWVIENKLTFSWDLCNSIRQELIEGGNPHDFAAVKARIVQMMQSPSVVPSSVPPKNRKVLAPHCRKSLKVLGGNLRMSGWKLR